MQVQKALPPLRLALSGKERLIALALTIVLAGCQAATPGDTASAKSDAAPAQAHASTPVAAPAVEEPVAGEPTTTVADSSIDDDDLAPRRPDDSYRKANLRPEYDRCIEAAGAVTPDLYACNDEELAFHEQKLEAEFSKILALPDGQEKDKLMDEQAAYMHDTNRYCAFNPDEDGQGQMLDAQSCRINRTANRVEALQALNLK